MSVLVRGFGGKAVLVRGFGFSGVKIFIRYVYNLIFKKKNANLRRETSFTVPVPVRNTSIKIIESI